MNRLRGITMVMGFCAVLAASALGQREPLRGPLALELAQSTLPPGEPVPQDLLCELHGWRASREMAVTILTPAGRPHVETFEAAATGEFFSRPAARRRRLSA